MASRSVVPDSATPLPPGPPAWRVLCAGLVLLFSSMLHSPAWAQTSAASVVVDYQPPVGGAVVDGWRPPDGPYGAGNRGVDYATTAGDAVGSPAHGVVSFAGAVAGNRWVVVRHADGRRSSVGPLGSITVRTGQSVAAGQQVGTAAGSQLHWGVREVDVYVDPTSLLPVPVPPRGKLRLTG